MMSLLCLALVALAFGKDDCPDFRATSEPSECIWPRNADGHMSFEPLVNTFIDKCKINIDWKGIKRPDITDKFTIPFPEKCGKCSFKFACANREVKDGCFPVKMEKTTCDEHADVCDMPRVPTFNNCRWSALTALMGQCVTNRPDLAEWRRAGYHQGGRFMPEMNCVPVDGGGCKCCCHPNQPVKNGDAYTCQEAPKTAEAAACPSWDAVPYNDWSECLWYPLTDVAVKVNEHCGLSDIVEGMDIGKIIQLQAEKAKKDPDRVKMLEKMPSEKCGYCSFRVRCRKRPNSDVCFPFDGDKKACGADDCDTCAQPCEMTKVDADMAAVAKIPEAQRAAIVGSCDYHKMVMAYLKGKAGKFMKMMGKNSYWKKRGMASLMKFVPMGKCKEVDGKCMCCCHPYRVSDDNTQCVLADMCKLPHDLGLEWTTNE